MILCSYVIMEERIISFFVIDVARIHCKVFHYETGECMSSQIVPDLSDGGTLWILAVSLFFRETLWILAHDVLARKFGV